MVLLYLFASACVSDSKITFDVCTLSQRLKKNIIGSAIKCYVGSDTVDPIETDCGDNYGTCDVYHNWG